MMEKKPLLFFSSWNMEWGQDRRGIPKNDTQSTFKCTMGSTNSLKIIFGPLVTCCICCLAGAISELVNKQTNKKLLSLTEFIFL